MKIAYDHQIFGWQQYGGISRYFYELARNIAAFKEAEVTVVSPVYVNSYLHEPSDGLRVIGRRVPAIRRTGRIFRAANQLLAPTLMRKLSPDIVHETYYSRNRCAPSKSRVVLTVFDMIHERYPASFPAWDTTSQEKALAVKRADHIICISEQTRSDLVEILNVNPDDTSVVHLGFSLTQGDTERVFEPVANGRPYILYVGSRGGYKNFDGFIRAFASNKRLRNNFDVVAFGGGGFSASELSSFSELGLLSGHVRQVAGDDAQLADLYRGAELFVYPSMYEGFGIPPLEAMSFDCPVACSNTSSIPEVVGDAAFFFDPSDVASIENALVKISESNVLRNSLIRRGRKRIEVFSWKKCAEETVDIYREVLI